MINATDIFEEIESMIKAANSDVTVYKNDIPWDFERPSFLLEQISRTEQAVAKSLNQVTVALTVTCFTDVDDHGIADQAELIRAQYGVIGLFSAGYITVGDRALRVISLSGEVDKDAAYVDVIVEYFEEARKDTTAYQKMGAIEITTKTKEG